MVTKKRLLWALVFLGLATRIGAWAFVHPGLHPDAFFQYWEPAWWHWHGYGWRAWEWGTGLRSWLLPAYNGAWLVLLEMIGFRNPHSIFRTMLLHWAIASAAIVPAAFRAGAALQKMAGIGDRLTVPGFTALLAAVMPILVHFSPQTITEVPGAILFAWGYCHWLESRVNTGKEEANSAFWAGIALSAGACLRIPNGPLAIVPVLDLLLRRRFRSAFVCMGAAMIPLAIFAITDWITWGKPLHSAMAFIKYNFIDGRAIEHGMSPRNQYFEEIYAWLGIAFVPIAVVLMLQIRKVWTLLLPSILLVCLLTTQAHKESRFILLSWTLGTLATGAAVGFSVDALVRRFERSAALHGLGALFALLVTIVHARGLKAMPELDYSGKWPVYEAQAWVGAQADLTGLMVFDRLHLSGGWALVGKNVPFEVLSPHTGRNPIFNYAIAPQEGDTFCRSLGMSPVWEKETFKVWRR